MFVNFLISLAISHSFLDIYAVYPDYKFWIIYLYSICVVNSLIYASKIPYIFFILFSMYHFGKDFYYISGSSNTFDIWGGVYIISSTSFKNRDWLMFFNKVGIEEELSDQILILLNLSFYISAIAILIWGSWFAISYCIIFTLIFSSNYNEFSSILAYFCIIHSPLAVYRFYLEFGKIVIFLWIFMGIFINSIQKIPTLDKELINIIISIIIVHMFVISTWQTKIIQN